MARRARSSSVARPTVSLGYNSAWCDFGQMLQRTERVGGSDFVKLRRDCRLSPGYGALCGVAQPPPAARRDADIAPRHHRPAVGEGTPQLRPDDARGARWPELLGPNEVAARLEARGRRPGPQAATGGARGSISRPRVKPSSPIFVRATPQRRSRLAAALAPGERELLLRLLNKVEQAVLNEEADLARQRDCAARPRPANRRHATGLTANRHQAAAHSHAQRSSGR